MSIIISDDIPAPINNGLGRPMRPENVTLTALNVGQSFCFEASIRSVVQGHIARLHMHKASSKRFTVRREGDGYRVWRVA